MFKGKCIDKVGPLKGKYGAMTVNDKEMCDEVNEYFCSVFNAEDDNSINVINNCIEQVFQGDYSDMFCDINFTQEIICNKFEKFACK